jgi:hypothetical protein
LKRYTGTSTIHSNVVNKSSIAPSLNLQQFMDKLNKGGQMHPKNSKNNLLKSFEKRKLTTDIRQTGGSNITASYLETPIVPDMKYHVLLKM